MPELLLHPKVTEEIRAIQHRLLDEGKLPSPEKLRGYYAAFRERFGPERLQSMDGKALLIHMHGLFSDNRETMVYWLEFKNDEEFPGIFGSISGGSSLKFGVYPNAQTGQWMTRDTGNYPVPIELDAAVEIARKHRAQLVRGCELLERLSADASDDDYRQLQQALDQLAPNVSRTAWGHKYFSLLFPDKLDDYHVEHYQRFHLVRLLQVPPPGDGRFLAAGPFVRAARALEMPMNHLTTILNERSPRPYRYWRLVASYASLPGYQNWPLMRDGGFAAAAFPGLEDLTEIVQMADGKKHLANKMGKPSRWAKELWDFFVTAAEGDLIFAIEEGDQVAGIGRLAGPYYYVPDNPIPHRRQVEWLSAEEWDLQPSEGKGSTFREISDYANQVEAERRILLARKIDRRGTGGEVKPPPLTGIPGRIADVLERKGQVILYGPPGTGKTYWAERAARELAARHAFSLAYESLSPEQQAQVIGGSESYVRLCTFHPAYGYEDFLEGYRPKDNNGSLHFSLEDGIFKRLCRDAAAQPERRFFLIVDEINRGDIPRIFSELLTLLEKDKRGKQVMLPLSGALFAVPPNIYLIGTMNTADRSIALLDTALRRRFGFIELMPEPSLLGDAAVHGVSLQSWLRALNGRIVEHIGRDARNLQIGHAYLLEGGSAITGAERFARVIREDILPLLEEYCYEDFDTLKRILGDEMFDSGQRIRQELFEPGHETDLVRALVARMPELTTTAVRGDEAFDGEGREAADEDEGEVDEESGADDGDAPAA